MRKRRSSASRARKRFAGRYVNQPDVTGVLTVVAHDQVPATALDCTLDSQVGMTCTLLAVGLTFDLGQPGLGRAAPGGIPAQVADLQQAVSTLQMGAGTPVTCGPISQPGLYVLNQNLTASGSCLVIHTDSVTVDLRGFAITGNGSGSGVTDGGAARSATVIRNGTIASFDIGIDLGASTGTIVEHVRLVNDGLVAGRGSIVRGNTILQGGIVFGSGDVTGNIVSGSPGRGIEGGAGVVAGNTVSGSGDIGILIEGAGATISGNSVFLNHGGINAQTGNAILNNIVVANQGDGIASSPQNTVSGNTASTNTGRGIVVICPSNVLGNTAVGSGTPPNLSLITTFGACNTSNNLAP
jgi:Right handed beta helix region